jgi:hypothetical protein
MDQAVAIIIASAISVVGAVGGSLGGVLISNHHTAKLEDKRIEHEKTQERAKIEQEKLQKEQDRHRALLEELCSLVYISQIDMVFPYFGEDNYSYSSVVKAMKNIERMAVIVTLYYSGFTQTFGKFQDSYHKLEHIHDQIYQLRPKHPSLQEPKVKELLKQSVEASEDFAKIRSKFIIEIKDLSKTMI